MSELLKINVSDHTEKKGGLTYLSWAWAWAEVLKIDPGATWEAAEYNGMPCMFLPDGSAMVKTCVTISGKVKTCTLPVMDNRNNAVKNPDARKVSDAIMRCMTKAIAMHGLGLYIYAGEDLPMDGEPEPVPEKRGVVADVTSQMPPLTLEERTYFDELAADVVEVFKITGQADAFDRIEREQLDNDQRIHLWGRLDSKLRSALKAEKGLRIGAA